MAFGDRKPYIVALLTPNLERLIDWARTQEITYIDINDLVNLIARSRNFLLEE